MTEIRLTMEEINTLYMCRNKAREVARVERMVNAPLPISVGLYSSPGFDGMPGARDVHGLDGSAAKNEAVFQWLERGREELKPLCDAAQRIICTLKPDMHDFCMAYFVRGEDIGEVARQIGRDESTCRRKLRKIRAGSNFRRIGETEMGGIA